MREILFRGKAINREDGFNYRSNYKNGDWVYGLITKKYNEKYDLAAEMTNEIGISGIEVDYKTIGQFTGLTDKNGVKIFEGDILKISEGNDEDDYVIRKVYAYRGVLCVDYWTPDWDFNALAFLDNDNGYVFEIIGNIYDNPELIEDGD